MRLRQERLTDLTPLDMRATGSPPNKELPPRAPAVDVGRNNGAGTTPLEVELSEDQIFALEDDPSAVVGQCI